MTKEEFRIASEEARKLQSKKTWKIAGWILASPLILYICLWLVLPIVVISYHALSSHPKRIHGEHPSEFAGLFVNEDVESERNIALALRPDGRVDTLTGWGSTFWHVDGDTLFIDSFPANCTGPMPLRGIHRNVVEFVDEDRLSIWTELEDGNLSEPAILVRTTIDGELWAEMARDSDEHGAWSFIRQFRIRYALSRTGVSEDDQASWKALKPATS